MATSFVSALTRRLEGKVAIITGGASGIGKSTAKLFAKHGAKVVIADIQDDLGRSVCEEIGPSDSMYVHCDVSNEDHIKNTVDKVVSTHGKLDIMFNNAAVFNNIRTSITETRQVDFDRVMSVNVTGVFLGMKHAGRVMIPARKGSIISTASTASKLGGLAPAYSCSKHGVVGLTKSGAAELGQYGIRVNCISPYGIATPLTVQLLGCSEEEIGKKLSSVGNLKGVVLKAEDIANAALYLASDEARYVSGHNLFVDGGYTVVDDPLVYSIFDSIVDLFSSCKCCLCSIDDDAIVNSLHNAC